MKVLFREMRSVSHLLSPPKACGPSLLYIAVAVFAFGASVRAATYTIIDPPYATASFPTGVNDYGVIAGYFDQGRAIGGFVRSPNGIYTTFDPPATGVNNRGWVIGQVDADHGFIRKPNGHVRTFGVNGGHNLVEAAINGVRSVCGSFTDDQNEHGYLRTADGTVTVFDPPDARRTVAGGINDSGAITGSFVDIHSVGHGFVRAPDGTITAFDPPGSPSTLAYSINAGGSIVGEYGTYAAVHGFIRDAAGNFTS